MALTVTEVVPLLHKIGAFSEVFIAKSVGSEIFIEVDALQPLESSMVIF